MNGSSKQMNEEKIRLLLKSIQLYGKQKQMNGSSIQMDEGFVQLYEQRKQMDELYPINWLSVFY
ncbi:MAG: hypothetical protein RJA07_335 [Bacteroidota bacterium]|jgi:hypothetical protein